MSIFQIPRNLVRLREVVSILARYGLADWVSRADPSFARMVLRGYVVQTLSEESRETRIRLALTELGATFIKLGQILSTRADLVGAPLAHELTRLQEQIPPDPPDVVVALIEKELHRPIQELFAEFEPKALASASIGQVHRARLADGRAVVVKVQHANIEAKIRTDLEILHGLARLAERHPELRQYRPVAVVKEVQQTLLRELEFRREGRNLQQFANNFAADPTVHFPLYHPELSGDRVLTMEYLGGTSLRDAERLRDQGLDPGELARRGALVFLEMIFRDGFYHADPHPGNLLVLADGRLGVLDCGMVGRIDDRLREGLEEMILAVARRDAARLTRVITRLCSVPAEIDRGALAADTNDFLAYYSSLPLNQFDLGGALTELTEIIRRHRLLLPSGLSMLIKALVTLEGTARLLNPAFNLQELVEPYLRKLARRRLSPRRQLQKLMRIYGELEYLVEVLPRGLADLFEQLQAGKFDVHLQHRRLEPSVNRLVFGIVTSALFLGSSWLWSSKAEPLLWDVPVLGVLGCFVSVCLGFRLVWAISKSGHLDSDP